MADIYAVIDLGKSLCKVIWAHPPIGKKQLLLLEPEIVPLTPEDTAIANRENADPEKDAWLVYGDGTGEALGFLTRTPRYRSRSDIAKDKLKSVHGPSRCLAVLGAIAERADFTSDDKVSEFSAALSILVPLSEWSTRKDFRQDLINALQGFNFRGRQYRVHPELLDMKPEGLGLMMRRQLQLTKDVYRNRTIGCLMLGHYNSTLYLYQGGQKIVDECSSRGFHQVVDAVVAETALDPSDTSASDLTEAIFEARTNPVKLRNLLWRKVGGSEKLDQQVQQTVAMIEKASTNYWKAQTQWINNTLGANRFQLAEIAVPGGAAQFFKSEIEGFFADCDILWSCNLNYSVANDFSLRAEDPMAYRLADAYSVYDWLEKTSHQPTVGTAV